MRSSLLRSLPLALLVAHAAAAHADAQSHRVVGAVRDAAGRAVPAANVFLLESLDGALSGDSGAFAFSTAVVGPATLVVRKLGFLERRQAVTLPLAAPLAIELAPAALAPVTVQAGAYGGAEEGGTSLTALDVVTTPGTAADVSRAVQSLPGVQAVDEGTALHVRGGHHTETRILLDDAVLANAPQLYQFNGTFVGTVDPFLLDDIFFSSGGFGARYGDALSAVVALRTMGKPARSSATASVGLAGASASGAVALPGRVGVRAAANRLDLGPLFRVNGNPQRFAPPPRGRDVSLGASWAPRPRAELKLFAIDQRRRLAVPSAEASWEGAYADATEGRTAVASWRDVVGPISTSAAVGESRILQRQGYGAFELTTVERRRHLQGRADWSPAGPLVVRAGGEVERPSWSLVGTIPDASDDLRPDARRRLLGGDASATRTGLWLETDWRPRERLRAVAGLRTDRSTLTGRRTVDPRLSLAWAPAPAVALTAAWGVYHQVPEPALTDSVAPSAPRPMRATHAIVGLQVGGEEARARVELYEKRYADLSQLSREYAAVGGGVGRARGADVLLVRPLLAGASARLSYSLVHATRTDPNTGVVGPAPQDVRHSATAVLERSWGPLRTALAWRQASGRPYTAVTGAALDSARGVYAPDFGLPMAERLPAMRRLDLAASYLRAAGPSLRLVLYGGLTNALDRVNVFTYRYSRDYAERIPVRSVFNRSVFVGASLTRH